MEVERKFLISLFLTLPVLVLSPSIQSILKFSILAFQFSDFLLSGLATAVVVYGGKIFFEGAVKSIKRGVLDMNVLVT